MMWVFLAYRSLKDYNLRIPYIVKVFTDHEEMKNYSADLKGAYVSTYYKITEDEG